MLKYHGGAMIYGRNLERTQSFSLAYHQETDSEKEILLKEGTWEFFVTAWSGSAVALDNPNMTGDVQCDYIGNKMIAPNTSINLIFTPTKIKCSTILTTEKKKVSEFFQIDGQFEELKIRNCLVKPVSFTFK